MASSTWYRSAREAVALLAVLAASLSLPAPALADQPHDPHEQLLQVVNELNRMNPFAQVSPSPGPGGQALQLSPEIAQKFAWATKVLQNPAMQKYLHVMSDPSVQQDVQTLWNHPKRMALLGWELGWMFFMLFFKAWRLTKSRGLFSMLYTQFWTTLLFLFGVLFLLPRLILGVEYEQLVHHLIQAIQR